MSFIIGQNDLLPRIIATLGVEFDRNYPQADQIIFKEGDEINMYIKRSGTWYTRSANVEEAIKGGNGVRVSVTLDEEDVKISGRYPIYFRNETTQLSFPSEGLDYVIVEERGHD